MSEASYPASQQLARALLLRQVHPQRVARLWARRSCQKTSPPRCSTAASTTSDRLDTQRQ